jgi:hypothetical protein
MPAIDRSAVTNTIAGGRAAGADHGRLTE